MFAWQNQPWQDSQLSRGEQLVNASAKLCQFWTSLGIQDTGQRRSRCGFFGGSAEWMSGWISFHSRHTHKVSLLYELAYVCSSCSHGKNLFHKFHMKISWFQSASWYEPSKKNILGKLTIKTDWLIDEIRKQILHLTVRASIETLVANWTRMSHHLWHFCKERYLPIQLTPVDGSSQHDSQVDSSGQISTHTEDTQTGGSRPWWHILKILFGHGGKCWIKCQLFNCNEKTKVSYLCSAICFRKAFKLGNEEEHPETLHVKVSP